MKTLDKIAIGGIGFGLGMIAEPLISKYLGRGYGYVALSLAPVILCTSATYLSSHSIERIYKNKNESLTQDSK